MNEELSRLEFWKLKSANIRRQSALKSAVEFTKNLMWTPEQVIELAKKFEKYLENGG